MLTFAFDGKEHFKVGQFFFFLQETTYIKSFLLLHHNMLVLHKIIIKYYSVLRNTVERWKKTCFSPNSGMLFDSFHS